MFRWNSSGISGLFQRETSGGSFVPEIDGLRFFAIAAVLIFHVNNYLGAKSIIVFYPPASVSWINALVEQGRFGVPLFFAISGFILARPFARQRLLGDNRVVLKKYFLRRVTRIEPPYIINMMVCFSLLAITKHQTIQLLPHLLASLAYMHNVIYGQLSPINVVAWSLEIEVQFYLLAPMMTLVFCIQSTPLRRAVLGAAMTGFGLLRYVLPDEHGFTLLHQMQYFLAGFLLTDFYLLDWNAVSARRLTWDMAGLLGWISMLTILIGGRAVHVITPWLILLVYSAAFRGRIWSLIVRSRPVYLIGGMCYSIYLWHPLIISCLGRLTVRCHIGYNYSINCLFQEAMLLPALVVCSAVCFLLFEKPFMKPRWPNAWLSLLRKFKWNRNESHSENS